MPNHAVPYIIRNVWMVKEAGSVVNVSSGRRVMTSDPLEEASEWDLRARTSNKDQTLGKGKGKVHPITGHEGPEME
jgi:hypothetical protein